MIQTNGLTKRWCPPVDRYHERRHHSVRSETERERARPKRRPRTMTPSKPDYSSTRQLVTASLLLAPRAELKPRPDAPKGNAP